MNSSDTSLSPSPRNGKFWWYNQYQRDNFLSCNNKAKILMISHSIVSILSRYPEVWTKYLLITLNFGPDEDKVKNALPSSSKT